jgi:hypothetical protein
VTAVLEKPVTVAELSDSGLIRQRWVFSLRGPWLVLDRYIYERRYATTQEFKAVKFYDRHRDPEESYGDWQWLGENEVPWDDDLQSQALVELMSRVHVVRQSDLSSPEPVGGAESPSSSQ